jgi:hypothetical protein
MALAATTDEVHWVDFNLDLPFNEVELLSVCEFIHRPWFERLWILQEVHLASTVEVMCGNRTTAWSVSDDSQSYIFPGNLCVISATKS